MSELIIRGVSFFEMKTQIEGKLVLDTTEAELLFLTLGILLLVAGSAIYRFAAAVMAFIATSVILCIFMENMANWRAIVTAFTILGCLLGYFAFNWKKLTAILLSGMIAAALMWLVIPNLWAVIIAGIIACIITYFLPYGGISAFTAIAGTVIIGETTLQKMEPMVLGGFVILGISIQFALIGRKAEGGEKLWQKFFVKK